MAWTNKILRVNLTAGTLTYEPLNKEWVNDYLGQRGLGTRYYVEEVDPEVDPLSPENTMIFATGPLTGTAASTSARYSVITKGPLTGAIACSNSGGFFGPELKFAGLDMIILEGKSPEPVYLYIENDEAKLLFNAELSSYNPAYFLNKYSSAHYIWNNDGVRNCHLVYVLNFIGFYF